MLKNFNSQFFTVYVHFNDYTLRIYTRRHAYISEIAKRVWESLLLSRILEIVSRRRGLEMHYAPPQGTLEFSILCRWIALINETIWLPKMLFSTASGDCVCTMKVYKTWLQNPNILEIDADPARKNFRKMFMLSA